MNKVGTSKQTCLTVSNETKPLGFKPHALFVDKNRFRDAPFLDRPLDTESHLNHNIFDFLWCGQFCFTLSGVILFREAGSPTCSSSRPGRLQRELSLRLGGRSARGHRTEGRSSSSDAAAPESKPGFASQDARLPAISKGGGPGSLEPRGRVPR